MNTAGPCTLTVDGNVRAARKKLKRSPVPGVQRRGCHGATMSQRPREGLYSQIRLYKLLAQAISALPSEADITEAREHVR